MKPRKKQRIDDIKDTGEVWKKDEVNKVKKAKKQKKQVIFEEADLSSDEEEGLDEIVEDGDDQGGISTIT
jgi:hypothetical protein